MLLRHNWDLTLSKDHLMTCLTWFSGTMQRCIDGTQAPEAVINSSNIQPYIAITRKCCLDAISTITHLQFCDSQWPI